MNKPTTACNRYFFWTLSAILCVILAVFLMRQLLDPDFYWHLKTGEWIWQHKALMSEDPYTILPLPPPSPKVTFILSSYWLYQLLIYGFYALFGMAGMIVLRTIVAIAMIYGCSRWVAIRNNPYTLSAMAIGGIFMFDSYFVERPQFISFVFFGVLLVILFKFFENPQSWSLLRLTAPLVFLMIFWCNMHGGFFVGQAILIFCLVAEGLKFLHPRLLPLQKKQYVTLAIATMAALVASLANPNPVTSAKLLTTFGSTNNFLYTTNLEYVPLLNFIEVNHNRIAMLYLAFMVLTALFFVISKHHTNLTWLGILLITAIMGYQHIRYIPFYFVAATLFTMKYFEPPSTRLPTKILLLLFLTVTVAYSVSDEPDNLKKLARYGLVSAKNYPVYAAEFVDRNNFGGNLFNHFDWGGYLVWRLGDKNRIFCDGRQLDAKRYWEWINTSGISSTQEPYWKKLFDRYDIQTVILPFFGKNGETFNLTRSIRMDKDWIMVFAKGNAAVFRRAPRP